MSLHIAMLLVVFFSSLLSTAGQDMHVIPFRLTDHNNISVEAILNGIDTVDLMVHTAANSLTLTETAVKRLKSISFAYKVDSIKSWGGETNSARVSPHNSIQIGDLHWQNVSIWENVNSAQGSDGKFGIDLFSMWHVQIDYDLLIIRLFKNLPRGIGMYEKLKLENKDGDLFIEALLSTKTGTVRNKFLIHSGYAGALLLDDLFAQQADLNNALDVVSVQNLTDSFGNIVKVKKVILPVLTIGNIKLNNVPAGFFDGAIGTQKMSILGGDVLKRFDLIIDAKREFVYVKPSRLLKSDYTKLK